MLQTQRSWSGREQRRNFLGLGAYEIPFLFLNIWIYVCCWLGGSVGDLDFCIWIRQCQELHCSLGFTVFIYSQHIDHGMNTNF